MVVSIEFLGMQRVLTKTDGIDIPLTDRMMVYDVLEYVRERYPTLNLGQGTVLITVNQKIAPLDRVLRANDTVSFLPFISGG
jgi:molybdopterin converting factor small subunit